ncbi:MAG: A/G-specific adenine glycosylase [Candidatus Pacebacteria bacterium]|nr:A/G-specific adenine glycosylase [Candidatus Paceibacterota bacterium]
MLQQTQVDRVVPKYQSFLDRFPTITILADAPLRDVLSVWQGLGYNRRAKMLLACAKEIVQEHNGRIPRDIQRLEELPGIGPYTAGAVMAFAWNAPSVFIETNIRSVFIHFFFSDSKNVSDKELLPYVEKTLDREDPREWYYALMDYGTRLKREGKNPSQKSRHHIKQTPFKGSNREIRGAIMTELTKYKLISIKRLLNALRHFEESRVREQLDALKREGMIVLTKTTARIA